MCTCKFCGTLFSPRPQTKNPIACNKLSCQKARQAKNESSWHKKNSDLYLKNSKYHQVQRVERHRIISQHINHFLDAIFSGLTLKGISVNDNLFTIFFSNFMCSVGLRQINKFCNEKKTSLNQTFANI